MLELYEKSIILFHHNDEIVACWVCLCVFINFGESRNLTVLVNGKAAQDAADISSDEAKCRDTQCSFAYAQIRVEEVSFFSISLHLRPSIYENYISFVVT